MNKKFINELLDNASFGTPMNLSSKNLQNVYNAICKLYEKEDIDTIVLIVEPLAKGVMSAKTLKKHIRMNIDFVHSVNEQSKMLYEMALLSEPEGDSIYW